MSAIDWTKLPEPWRSVGREWVEMLPTLMAGSGASSGHDHFRPESDYHHGREWRRRRKAHGLTILQLAAKIGVSYTLLQRAEQRPVLSRKMTNKLRKALDGT